MTTHGYADGFFDREEREFYGSTSTRHLKFGVMASTIDAAGSPTTYVHDPSGAWWRRTAPTTRAAPCRPCGRRATIARSRRAR
ncbi:MAG TPA: hypothetical protein VNM66_06800 [Thermodesulfobacteriota bacterium]|nr:hypothetical protein [Thermodesulfobacteriota bacterium]